MSWSETFRTAVEALLGRRMRSLLTMLGILIGIAAVIQRERSPEAGAVPVVVETHEAPESAVAEASPTSKLASPSAESAIRSPAAEAATSRPGV